MNSSDLKAIQKVADLVYNYTSCLDLARFQPVASEAEMERIAQQLHGNNTFLGGETTICVH
jgi:hypothetical protein